MTSTPNEDTLKLKPRSTEEIQDRLGVLVQIEKKLLLYPPAPYVENALWRIRNKISILNWVLGDGPVASDTLKEKTND